MGLFFLGGSFLLILALQGLALAEAKSEAQLKQQEIDSIEVQGKPGLPRRRRGGGSR